MHAERHSPPCPISRLNCCATRVRTRAPIYFIVSPLPLRQSPLTRRFPTVQQPAASPKTWIPRVSIHSHHYFLVPARCKQLHPQKSPAVRRQKRNPSQHLVL